MPRTPSWPPPISLHSSGQARIRIQGKVFYLGVHGSEAARKKYLEIVGDIEKAGGQLLAPSNPDSAPLVAEIVARFLREADASRRNPDGTKKQELVSIEYALRPLLHHLGGNVASELAPRHLREVRGLMLTGYDDATHGEQGKQILRTANRNFNRVRMVFRWAASEGLFPAELFHRFALIKRLAPGEAEDAESVKPVPDRDLKSALARMRPMQADMVNLQLLTGCRPCEVVGLKPGEVQQKGKVWLWLPVEHKNRWRGHARTIYLGPQAQQIVKRYLKRDPGAFCFSPREACQQAGRKIGWRKIGERYRVRAYEQAIRRACERAGVTPWAPGQLRHNAATRFVSEFGWEVARMLLGHLDVRTTQIYAQDDTSKAMDAARKAG